MNSAKVLMLFNVVDFIPDYDADLDLIINSFQLIDLKLKI